MFDFEINHGGMTEDEYYDYHARLIDGDIQRLKGRRRTRIAFNDRGNLYRRAFDVAPDARLDDILSMHEWFTADGYELLGKVSVDLAAGTGFLTKPLARWTHETTYAVDPSEVQLRALLRYCHDEIWAVKGSPDKRSMFTQIRPGTVDLVTSFGGMHHVPNQRAMFENVARLLKPGGRMVAADVCGSFPGYTSPLQVHFDDYVAAKCLTGHTATWLYPNRLEELCHGLPLTVHRVEAAVPLTWKFYGDRAMALFFKGLHAYDLPEAEIVQDLNEALGVFVDQDKTLCLNWPMLFFEIRRI